MGMLLDDREIGMDERSRRYSMLVRDDRIEKMFAEPRESGDPYSVSDADTMFDWLAPKSARPPRIDMLTRLGCPFCAHAGQMLNDRDLRFDEVALDDGVRYRVLGAEAGATTVPQDFVDGRLVGGTEALEEYLGEQLPGG
ncbi:MAG: glutaredoxin domain-containing protein [Panacagrimonas sp.]